jgi:hypothetical protein
MMLGGAMWSVLTINAGFISIVIETFTRGLSRVWLALPALWFGGYAALAMMSHAALRELDSEFSDFNIGVYADYNSDKDSLVIGQGMHSASDILLRYDVPVVFQDAGNKTGDMRSHRLGGATICKRLQEPDFRSGGIFTSGFHETSASRNRLVTGMCVYTAEEPPSEPAVRVTAVEDLVSNFLLPHRWTTISIEQGTGTPRTLNVGYAHPLQWWPAFAIGCGLNSGQASWNCGAGFMRRSVPVGASNTPNAANDVVARALRLTPSLASSRRARIDAQQSPIVEQLLQTRLSKSLAMLDRVLADPKQSIIIFDIAGLNERPDLFVGRLEAMTAATTRLLNAGPAKYETARTLQMLIAKLAPAEFAMAGQRILNDLASRANLNSKMVDQDFARRAGDLGPAALPLLTRLAFELGPKWSGSAIWGLCRMGRPAAHLADQLAKELREHDRGILEERHSASYVTLLRLGRTDLADADPDRNSRSKAEVYAAWRKSVTPASDPNVCKGH